MNLAINYVSNIVLTIISCFLLCHKLIRKYILSSYVIDSHSRFSFKYYVSNSCSK